MCQNSTVTVNTYSCLIKPENYNNKKTTKVDCKVYHAFLFQLFFLLIWQLNAPFPEENICTQFMTDLLNDDSIRFQNISLPL